MARTSTHFRVSMRRHREELRAPASLATRGAIASFILPSRYAKPSQDVRRLYFTDRCVPPRERPPGMSKRQGGILSAKRYFQRHGFAPFGSSHRNKTWASNRLFLPAPGRAALHLLDRSGVGRYHHSPGIPLRAYPQMRWQRLRAVVSVTRGRISRESCGFCPLLRVFSAM
jgi:hypothetical protein